MSINPISFGQGVNPIATTPTKAFGNALYDADSMVQERLYMINPRSAATEFTSSGLPQYTSDRGKIASIRLLSNDIETSKAARTNRDVDLTNEMNALLTSATGFQQFMLTDVKISYNEKMQVNTTFGDAETVYYFGRQPVTVSLSGLLFDSIYNDWFTKFVALYNTTFRGTQLARMFELVEIVLPNMTMRGSIFSLQHSQNAARDAEIPFGIQFLAKEIIPTAMPNLDGTFQSYISGELLDWSVGKEGVGGKGYSLSTGIGGGMVGTASEAISSVSSLYDSVMAGADAFSKTLNSFRTSIFSPIYGIISSITKIIKTVSGDITSILTAFTNPLNRILRDINNISSQAVAIANLIEFNFNRVISIPDRVIINARNTLAGLKNSAGVISRVPESLSEVLKRHFRSGRVKRGAAILSSGKGGTKSKAAVLSSGAPYSPSMAYRI